MDNSEIIRSKENSVLPVLKIGGVLMLICAVVALILSFVNMVTRDKIAENAEKDKRDAIISLFDCKTITYDALDGVTDVNALYEVKDGETLLGYCASVSSNGFGGNIDMMVALDGNCTVTGVKIVALSETPGLGSRVTDDTFLANLIGKGLSIVVGKDVDAISGSTISSKAVVAGVNAATAALNAYITGGEQ